MKVDETPEWAPAIGAIALVLLLFSLALVAAGGWVWFAAFLESSAAGWVQAVGSVAAILAAAWLASWQLRRTREAEAQARKERMQAMLEVIATLNRLLILEVEARAAFMEQCQDMVVLKQFLTDSDPFADIETSARQIPVHDLLDVATVRLVFDLMRLTRVARELNARLRDQFHEVGGIFLRARKPYGMVLGGLQELGARCDAAADSLKARG